MTNLQLFAACVAIWGSTWLAITFQLGEVAPEASVSYRFLFASLLLHAYCLLRRQPLGFALSQHAWAALFGVLMFGVQYIFVYYAERHVVSGLVAVGYSAIPLLGAFGLRFFFGVTTTRRVTAGALLGVAGIALVFLPELGGAQSPGDPLLGVLFTATGVFAAAGASLIAHRNQEAGLPLWPTMAWSTLYGAGFSLAVVFATRKALAFETSATYVLSLTYLAVFGSVIAFAAYLTLIERIGAARAGYIGVMVPAVALVISAVFEGFRWHPLTWAGIAVSVAGNVLVLRERGA